MAGCLSRFLHPRVQFIILDERLRELEPTKPATSGSAGFDLRACIDEPMIIEPGQRVLISTGLRIHLDQARYAGMILPRSGLGHKNGIVLGNLVGLIDSDYQGDLKMSVWNSSSVPFEVKPLDRLAQYIVVPVIHPIYEEVTEFVQSERGEGGFGSSGVSS